jgi:uncharacterized protein with gpF-like domain
MKYDDVVSRALKKNLSAYEREVMFNYAASLKAIRQDIGKIYERYAENGKLTNAEMSKYNRLASLERQLTEDLRPGFRKNTALLERMSKVEYEEGFFRTAWAIDQNTGVALRWGLLNPKAVEAAVANPLRKIAETRLKQDGIIKIRRAVSQGLIQGLSYPNMMRGIKDAINGNAADALRIVRTEGQRAQTLGQQANYERARDIGVEVVEIWDAALDDRTRDSHGALDGQPAQYDADAQPYWFVGGHRTHGPGQSGVAEEDCNCRCRVRGEVEGFAPEKRRVAGEITKYQTYSEWRSK